MKTVLLALVLATVAPARVRVGPVAVPAWQLLVLGEALAAVGGAWLMIRCIRRYRARRWPRLAYGSAW